MLKRIAGGFLIVLLAGPAQAQLLEYEVTSNPQITIDLSQRCHDTPDLAVSFLGIAKPAAIALPT